MIAITSVGLTHSPGALPQVRPSTRGEETKASKHPKSIVTSRKKNLKTLAVVSHTSSSTPPGPSYSWQPTGHLTYFISASHLPPWPTAAAAAHSVFFLSLSLSPALNLSLNGWAISASALPGALLDGFGLAPSAVSKTPPPIFVHNPAHLAMRTSVILLVRKPFRVHRMYTFLGTPISSPLSPFSFILFLCLYFTLRCAFATCFTSYIFYKSISLNLYF